MNPMRILVTGASGFLGKHLVQTLGESFPSAVLFGIDKRSDSGPCECYPVDLADPVGVRPVVREIRPDWVFHLAGNVPSGDWRELFRSNVETTIHLMESLLDCDKAPKVVVPASAAELGRFEPADLPLGEDRAPFPVTPYGVSKACQTAVARYHSVRGLEVVIGRVFNVVGEGIPESLSIGSFAAQLRRVRKGDAPPRILVGNLEAKRDFIDVRDVASALIHLARRGRNGEIYNICSGRSHSIRDVLATMIRCSGLSVDIVSDPGRVKPSDIPDSYGDNGKIFRDTGWRPAIPLEETLRRIVS